MQYRGLFSPRQVKTMSEKIIREIETLREIAEYIKTIDPAVVYAIENNEDNDLIVNFYTFGFDWTMLSGIQSIAKKHHVNVGFNVEPYSQKTVKLTLVISEVSEQ
jgi:hypothetical protein